MSDVGLLFTGDVGLFYGWRRALLAYLSWLSRSRLRFSSECIVSTFMSACSFNSRRRCSPGGGGGEEERRRGREEERKRGGEEERRRSSRRKSEGLLLVFLSPPPPPPLPPPDELLLLSTPIFTMSITIALLFLSAFPFLYQNRYDCYYQRTLFSLSPLL